VYDEGSQTQSFYYVDDLIEGMIRLMNGNHPDPINLGNPDEFTIHQIAELIREHITLHCLSSPKRAQ
jgi:UDP-glucuronate decarboxylase